MMRTREERQAADREAARRRRAANPEHVKAIRQAWDRKNADRCREQDRVRYKELRKDPEWVEKQRQANRKSYEKHKAARQERCREYQRKRHADNPDHVKQLQKAWNEKNKERIDVQRKLRRPKYKERELIYVAEWRQKNAEKRQDYNRKHYSENRETLLKKYKEWASRNHDKTAALAAKRRCTLLNATPPWADLKKIQSFYTEAKRLTKETGIAHHVDHIYPLKGKYVSGLHCEYNLQILTATENIRKGNTCLLVSTIN
jgi:hypothetical protein